MINKKTSAEYKVLVWVTIITLICYVAWQQGEAYGRKVYLRSSFSDNKGKS